MKPEETIDFHIRWAWFKIAKMYNQEASVYGLTQSSGFILLNIDPKKGTPSTSLGPSMGMEPTSLSRSLKNMEEKGWICREKDAEDKRIMRIKLTEDGRRLREVSKETVIAFNNRVLSDMDPIKLKHFREVIEVIDQHWAEVKADRENRGETDDPSKEFKRLAAIESHKNTNGKKPRYLPYPDASELVRTKTINADQLDRLQQIWKLIATARQEDDAPQDGVVEGEKEPVMNKTRLLAALVDRKRNNRIRRLLTGGHEGGADSDVNENSSLPSLMVLLKPNL